MFTIDDVIGFFGQELSYKILPKAMKCLLQHHRHQPKKKNDFRSKLSIFVRIFDPCDEIVKCLGLSTNMKICFRHNRCQY